MSTVVALNPVNALRSTTKKFEVACSSCNLRELCFPGTLCPEDMARVENVARGDVWRHLFPRHAFEHFAKERCILPADTFPHATPPL